MKPKMPVTGSDYNFGYAGENAVPLFQFDRLAPALKSFCVDTRANIAVIFAVAAVPVVLVAGVAVDYSRAHSLQLDLQVAADSAALAGASIQGASDGERIQLAKDFLSTNLSGGNVSPISNVTIGDGEVVVTVSGDLDNAFMSLAGMAANTVSASATAIFGSSGGPCVLVLSSNEKDALLLNSDSSIDAPDCTVHVNSSDSEALRGNSNGDITASDVCVNGGWVNDGTSQFNPSPSNCPVIDDPLASLPVPDEADDACDWTDLTVDGNVTLQPGVYCQKLELNSGANVTFAPGIYVMRDGEFIVNSGSSATASNFMMYLTGTSNNPRFNINSNSHIEFHGRESGTYAGMVFFQARDAVADFSILNSDSSSIIEGAIYLPNSGLHLNSNGNVADSSPWTVIVVETLEVNSDSTLNVNTDYASSSVPTPFDIAVDGEQQVVWLKK